MARRLLFAYFSVWLLEGAARKWLLPGVQEALYFARVPIVLLIVGFSVSRGAWPLRPTTVTAISALMIISAVTTTHIWLGDQTLAYAAFGLRLYVEPWIVPIALARHLNIATAMQLQRVVLFASAPLALLALAQVNASGSSGLNRLLASDGSDNFFNAGGVVRATSTFTSSLGHATFILLAVGCLLAVYFDQRSAAGKRAVWVGTPSLAILIFTSGSRSSAIAALACLLVLFTSGLTTRPQRAMKVVAVAIVLLALGSAIAPRIAGGAVDGLATRLTSSGAASEAGGRLLGDFYSWAPVLIEQGGLRGTGPGSAAQGLATLGVAGGIEGELSRWVIELGAPLFLLALVARAAICLWLLGVAWRARRSYWAPLAILSATMGSLATGPVTGQGTVCGLAAITGALLLPYRNVSHQ